MSASDKEVANFLKEEGAMKVSEYTKAYPLKDIRAAKSELIRAHRAHLIERVVTIKENGPVWLYYTDEDPIQLGKTRMVYVPLRRLDEFKKMIVVNEIKQLQKEGVFQGSIHTIAKRAGFPPSQIENEVYAFADELEFILVDKELQPIGLGPKEHSSLG